MATLLPAFPSRSLERFNEMMEDLFEGAPNLRPWTPSVDIKKTEKAYHLTMELPGLKREDIHVEMSNDVLTVRGEREFEKEETGRDYIRKERSWGKFSRSFKLDEPVRPEMITAEMKEGLLNITIPKIEPVAPYEVDIK